MIKTGPMIAAALLALGLVNAPAPALAADAPAAAPAAAPSAHYTTTDTSLGDLLDDPAAKAVLQKYIPQMIANPQIDMARSMTLKQLQSYSSDQLPDTTLAHIDVDLSKLPVRHS